jgi:hypothetical protein
LAIPPARSAGSWRAGGRAMALTALRRRGACIPYAGRTADAARGW